MKKFLISFFAIAVFALFTVINIKTAEAIKQKKEPWELGYGKWQSYSCGSTCTWARCEEGEGDCTFADQYTCPC